jgi:putative ABC transport system substrate-binding protein
MKRRVFIGLIGGAVATWPLGARAQKPRKWHPGESSAIVSARIDAFRDGLGAPGGDVEVAVRLANEQLDKLPAMAVELVDQNVEAICAVSPPAVLAARAATRSIPIIALDLESDPVANGWVVSLAHPGGNVTGAFLDLPGFNAKSLQFLREAVPTLAKVAVLWNPASGGLQLDAVRSAASFRQWLLLRLVVS